MVANIGFPIVLSIFLITKLEKTINTLQESINELLKTIDKKNKD
ncbi:YvrJ family protein (plasmid) [Enterococcus sp. FDAARGOS_553]|nr:YvrJ family protein [Enterococcus sp. FDAARGOS_553]AYY11279.1 YvrJ family protein [Enterococcus sp. FDAARGOS_553]